MQSDKPELAWNLQDYLDRGVEPPNRIESSPESCEGLMMSDDEIADYMADSVATIKVLQDKGSDRFKPVQELFFADLRYLVEIGRLSQDEYNEVIDPENYTF